MMIRAHRLYGFLLLSLVAVSAAPPSDPPYGRDAARADSLLRSGKPEEALAPIMAAHAAGMPEDSLYWLLSEAAWRKGALDTAMGFNLAIRTPANGPFRDSVLGQRFRLYSAAGLARDAEALRDSLPRSLSAKGRKRPLRVTARLGSGWFAERNDPARLAPFGDPVGYSPGGLEHRMSAGIDAPFARSGGVEWIAGLEAQGLKSYAKDSIDSRANATLREEGWLLPGLSIGAGAGGGRVTGSGWVGDCKGEASWLSLNPGGFTMMAAGVESEWDEEGRNRYQTAWLAWYRDQSLRTGRGFSFSAGFSAFRSDPIADASKAGRLYVDDVRSAAPVHYSDSAYANPIKPPSKKLAYQFYTGIPDSTEVSSRAPQSFLSFSPQATYAWPLPGKLMAEFTLGLSGSWYPQPYLRDYAPVPAGAPTSLPTASEDSAVLVLARSRSDGREYAAYLHQVSGGFEELYGPSPLRREKRTRLDGQGNAQATLRRAFGGWGTLSLAAMAKRYVSNMENASPIWIPTWDAGISLQWNGAWEW
jgi:hypothetical protein